jgi:hypothetical protein
VSGWTGIFVFLAIIVMCILAFVTAGAALAAMGVLAPNLGLAIAAGAVVGAIGGIVATGFSPTTNTTANFTPYVDSSYQLDPSRDTSGDALAVANNTRDQWIAPDIAGTPDGVQTLVSKIDIRKALACG